MFHNDVTAQPYLNHIKSLDCIRNQGVLKAIYEPKKETLMKKALSRLLFATLISGAWLTGEVMAQSETAIVIPASKNIKDLKIRGRVQSQFGYVQAENDNADDEWTTLEMRRVRLGMQGTLFQNVRARIEANLMPDGFSMRSAYLQWRQHKPAYIKIGYDKPTFGYEENTSSAAILTVERTLINNTVAPGPLPGATLDGGYGPLFYSFGAYTNQTNRNEDTRSEYLYGASAGVNLKEFMPDGQNVKFRVDLLRNDDTNGEFSFEEGFSVSGHYEANPFDLRAEYIRVDDFANNTTDGWYVMPSVYLSDQFQLVGRYEEAQSENATGLRAASRYARRADIGGGGDQRGNDYAAAYFGGNYYFAGHDHKIMAGVELSELETQSAGTLEATTLYAAWRMLF